MDWDGACGSLARLFDVIMLMLGAALVAGIIGLVWLDQQAPTLELRKDQWECAHQRFNITLKRTECVEYRRL